MRGNDTIDIKSNKISNGVKFEEALKNLEEIVNELESGNLPLEESLAKYEEGIRLVRLCQKKLQEAKKRIEILVKTKEGKIKLEPFEEENAKTKKDEE